MNKRVENCLPQISVLDKYNNIQKQSNLSKKSLRNKANISLHVVVVRNTRTRPVTPKSNTVVQRETLKSGMSVHVWREKGNGNKRWQLEYLLLLFRSLFFVNIFQAGSNVHLFSCITRIIVYLFCAPNKSKGSVCSTLFSQ